MLEGSDGFTRTAVWKRTLSEQGKKDGHPDARRRLREAFLGFRRRAAQLGGEIHCDLPHFTVHDITHLDALWEMVDLVAGPDYPLTPAEAFVLGGAILIHDLAMSQAAYQEEFTRLRAEPVWQDTVAGLLRRDLGRPATTAEIASPPAEVEQQAVNVLLRELHARQATALPTKEWGYAGTKFYLLDDADLRNAFGHDIGQVAFSHHWPARELLDPNKLGQRPAGGPGWLPPEWTVDLVKLACLLRTADACHCDDRRAPAFLAALRRPGSESDSHWRFQTLLRRPHLDSGDDRLRFRSSRPFNEDEIAAWWTARDWLTMLDGELRTVNGMLTDTGRPRLAANGVHNATDSERLAQDIRTAGWEPADVRLQVSNLPALVRRLGGEQLYGRGAPEVPLRELIQNAADAVRARRKMPGQSAKHGRIVAHLGRDDEAGMDWIEVADDGVGMSKGVLTDTLLDFGAAFWGTPKMRREHPGLEAAGMEATGQFGIGFYSVFMWGERVRVTTRRFDLGQDQTWLLEFSGLSSRPFLRRGTADERNGLPQGGTRVRVCCDPRNDVAARVLLRQHDSRSSQSSCTWPQLCEWIAPALDVDLFAEEGGSHEPVVKADDWLEIDAERLLRRMNWLRSESHHASATDIAVRCKDPLQITTGLMGVVTDGSGRPVARGTVWNLFDHRCQTSVGHTGGLRIEGSLNFFGIFRARPETAARSLGQRDDAADWRPWAAEQLRLSQGIEFDPATKSKAAVRLCPFVDSDPLPIGYCVDRWVSLNEFTDRIRSEQTFQIVSAWPQTADVVASKTKDVLTLVVSQHDSIDLLRNSSSFGR